MKCIRYLVIITVGFLLPFYGFSQTWSLGNFSFLDDNFGDIISSRVEDGFIPQSLDVFGNESFTIHFQESDSNITDWVLYYFEDLSNLNSEFSELLNAGWYPRDIAFDASGLWALFSKGSEPTVKSWRIVSIPYQIQSESDEAVQSLTTKITEQAGLQLLENRLLAGISYWDSSVTLLFLEPSTPRALKDFGFMVYPNDGESMAVGLTDSINGGGVIEGFLVTPKYLFVPMYF